MAINAGNSFRTRDKLNVGAQTFDIHRLEFLEKQGRRRPGKASLFTPPSFWRISCAVRMAAFVHAEDIRAACKTGGPGAPEKEEDRIHACTRALAGLHRRTRDRRSRHYA